MSDTNELDRLRRAENARLTALLAGYKAGAEVEAREADKARAELDQYADVIQRGKRLPAPELSQDPAFAAFVLGAMEREIARLRAENAMLSDQCRECGERIAHQAECGVRDRERVARYESESHIAKYERDQLRALVVELAEAVRKYEGAIRYAASACPKVESLLARCDAATKENPK